MGHELILAGMLIMAGENLDHKLLATRPRSVPTRLPKRPDWSGGLTFALVTAVGARPRPSSYEVGCVVWLPDWLRFAILIL
jgi:hypothetical protein